MPIRPRTNHYIIRYLALIKDFFLALKHSVLSSYHRLFTTREPKVKGDFSLSPQQVDAVIAASKSVTGSSNLRKVLEVNQNDVINLCVVITICKKKKLPSWRFNQKVGAKRLLNSL